MIRPGRRPRRRGRGRRCTHLRAAHTDSTPSHSNPTPGLWQGGQQPRAPPARQGRPRRRDRGRARCGVQRGRPRRAAPHGARAHVRGRGGGAGAPGASRPAWAAFSPACLPDRPSALSAPHPGQACIPLTAAPPSSHPGPAAPGPLARPPGAAPCGTTLAARRCRATLVRRRASGGGGGCPKADYQLNCQACGCWMCRV